MQTISGYQIRKKLHQGTTSLVYRAIRESDQQPVILKSLISDYPAEEDILRLQREYQIIQSIHSTGLKENIIQALGLEQSGNTPVLVEEDIGGASLAAHIPEQGLSVGDFLELACKLVRMLMQTHQQGVIHKDINPDNIAFNPETGQLKLIDFGLSTVLSREHPVLTTFNYLEGTLSYIAPEQTGRTSLSLDYRADYYSLGITYYHLLTGQLPFHAEDDIALVHSHIAKTATPPHNLKGSIPPALSSIILKLIAKSPDERYQSLNGLLQDLQQCQQQWSENKSIEEFELGRNDRSDRLNIPQTLYGRSEEIEKLHKLCSHWEDEKALLLIKGFSGVGKTALIQQVQTPLLGTKGYFFDSKIDQFQSHSPYSSLVQALSRLIHQILSEPETSVKRWRHEIASALGKNAGLLTSLLPELELLIGSAAPVSELQAAEAKNRFENVVLRFFQVLAQPQHPLVMFLDDLQWIDNASLQLLQLLMQDDDLKHLLLIGAYRDNEVGTEHPLTFAIKAMQEGEARIETIELKPLSPFSVGELVSDTLHTTQDRSAELSALIYKKTSGNAFFVHQFLYRIHEEGLLVFHKEQGQWGWDLEAIRESQVTDNVLDLLIDKINRLPAKTVELLQIAACLGNRFKLADLAAVTGESSIETGSNLWFAVEQELMIPQGQHLELKPLSKQSSNALPTPALYHVSQEYAVYQFAHDEIQRGAYALIPEGRLKQLHLKTGRLLWQNTRSEELEKRLFDIVNQLNLAATLIEDPEEQRELARLNLKAGQKANKAAAFERALSYFQQGRKLLAASSWDQEYALHFELTLALGEAEYVNGHFERARTELDNLLRQAASDIDRVKVYGIRILLFASQGDYPEAINQGLEALSICGIEIHNEPEQLQEQIAGLIGEINSQLDETTIEALFEQKELDDWRLHSAMQLATTTWSFSFLSGNLELTSALTLQMMRINLLFGHSEFSPYAYELFGMFRILTSGDGEAGYPYGKLGLRLMDRYVNLPDAGKTLFIYAYTIGFWKEPINKMLEYFLQAYAASVRVGDVTYAGYSSNLFLLYSILKGRPLQEILDESSRRRAYVRKGNDRFITASQQLRVNHIRCLQGLTDDPLDISDSHYRWNEEIQVATDNNVTPLLFDHYHIKGELAFYFGKYDEALEHAALALPFKASATQLVAINFSLVHALTLASKLHGQSGEAAKKSRESLAAYSAEFKHLAKLGPDNYQHMQQLLQAQLAAVEGEPMDIVSEAFDQAITSAAKQGYLQHEAVANELAGIYYLRKKRPLFATHYLTSAWTAWKRWGAMAKCRDIESRHEELFHSERHSSSYTLATMHVGHDSTGDSVSRKDRLLDLESLMKATRAISSELTLHSLLGKLLSIIMENMGARRVLLLLHQEGQWFIEGQVEIVAEQNRPVRQLDLHEPLDTSNKLPLSLVQTVAREQKTIMLHDASKDNPNFQQDDWFLQNKGVKSVLCTHLRSQNKLVGLLYLENDLVAGAFNKQRLRLLEMLTVQAAISIENASLYYDLEKKVRERTHELREAQAELVKHAREAGMAEIAQGVMHNIGNALTPLKTSAQLSYRLLQKSTLRHHLKEALTPVTGIIDASEHAEKKRLSQIVDLLPQGIEDEYHKLEQELTRINQRIEHIESIIYLQVKYTHAKAFKELLDINSVLKDALEMMEDNLVKYRILLQTEFSELPTYRGEKHQLLQIFINLIKNAKEAMESTPLDERRLTVSTTLQQTEDSSQIIIRIKDSGSGFDAAKKEQLFNFGYTTKLTGTGIGLHTSANYIISQGGKIEAESAGADQGSTFTVILPIE